eukprot:3123738-Pyramimonas_sp.AAC.2
MVPLRECACVARSGRNSSWTTTWTSTKDLTESTFPFAGIASNGALAASTRFAQPNGWKCSSNPGRWPPTSTTSAPSAFCTTRPAMNAAMIGRPS